MNQNVRTEKVLGKDKFNKIKNTSVMVIGLGGVGGITVEMLARCGINKLILVDYDTFEISNLNRQILSTYNVIGKYKVDVAKERIKEINKDCEVITYNDKVNDIFLSSLNIDCNYLIDACDDVNAKVELVKYAIKNNIKIISCCGTGNRLDPSKLYITNIWKTEYDPLAKKFRNELRKNNIDFKLNVVSSKERPVIKENGFVGSVSLVPNAAGILLASYVVNDVINNK